MKVLFVRAHNLLEIGSVRLLRVWKGKGKCVDLALQSHACQLFVAKKSVLLRLGNCFGLGRLRCATVPNALNSA